MRLTKPNEVFWYNGHFYRANDSDRSNERCKQCELLPNTLKSCMQFDCTDGMFYERASFKEWIIYKLIRI